MGYRTLRPHIDQNWEGGAAGLGELGTLARSGHLEIRSVKFICDNCAKILVGRWGLTTSVFHRTKSDVNLIATIKYLGKEWCHDIDISHEWLKRHADRLNCPQYRNIKLNIETDKLTDIIQIEANG
jgi:hypothetical protein